MIKQELGVYIDESLVGSNTTFGELLRLRWRGILAALVVNAFRCRGRAPSEPASSTWCAVTTKGEGDRA